MTRHEFQNALRRLRCIDRGELDDVGVVTDLDEWRRFRGDPVRWMVTVPDERADAVFGILMKTVNFGSDS